MICSSYFSRWSFFWQAWSPRACHWASCRHPRFLLSWFLFLVFPPLLRVLPSPPPSSPLPPGPVSLVSIKRKQRLRLPTKTKNTVLDTPLEDTEASGDTLTRGRLGLKLFIKMTMLTRKLFILLMLNLVILLVLSLTTATETGWMQDGLSEKICTYKELTLVIYFKYVKSLKRMYVWNGHGFVAIFIIIEIFILRPK